MTALKISNEDMKVIIKTIKFLEDSGFLIRGASEIIKMKEKNKNADLLLLGANSFSNILKCKRVKRSNVPVQGVIRAGEGDIRTGEGKIRASQDFLLLPHPLTNFEIQKYDQNEPKFNLN